MERFAGAEGRPAGAAQRRNARTLADIARSARYDAIASPQPEEAALIEIFVDADGCPVKDEVYVVATRYGVPVVLVANKRMYVPEGFGVELVVVDEGPDAADDWIAANVRAGDVVVTADLPLAARCLAAGARVLGTNGREIGEDAIGGLLATRELKSHLRGAGVMTGGPPPLSAKDRSRFQAKLDELVRGRS